MAFEPMTGVGRKELAVERFAIKDLIAWKNSPRRRPLLVQGARQVGKTWLIREFGQTHFAAVAYVNFLEDEAMARQFEGELAPARLLDAVTLYTGVNAKDPNTLVVFDEIQECPRALTSLKSFAERSPETALVAAGSLLGVALHRGVSFPVGKVDHLLIYPLSFDEFLLATGNNLMLDTLRRGDLALADSLSERYIEQLRNYYFVGGMPEVVQTFLDTGSFSETRKQQNRLLFDYEHDFSKYADAALAEKIRLVWNSAPGQLARENKKFVYSAVRTAPAHAATKRPSSGSWTQDCFCASTASRSRDCPSPPTRIETLSRYTCSTWDSSARQAVSMPRFSLTAMSCFPSSRGPSRKTTCARSSLPQARVVPYYWSAENSSGEVDFVYDYGRSIVAVEAKATTNLKAKSLRLFVERNHLGRGLRLSLSPFKEQDWVVNLPLYAAGLLPEWFAQMRKGAI